MRHLYWIKEGLRFAAIVTGAALLYSFISIINSESSWEDTINTGLIYLTMFSMFITPLCNLSAHQVFLPFTVSFGCTRKEAWTGLQFYRLTMLIPLVVITAICTMLMPSAFETAPDIIIALEVATYIFCCSIGGLLGILSVKLGQKMLRILSIIAVLIGFSIIAGIVPFMMLTTKHVFVWIVLGLMVLIYGLCSIAEVKTIKRLCVR